MLKLLTASIIFIMTLSNAITQDLENESKIKDFLGSQRFENSLKNNPGLLSYLDVKIKEGYAIENVNSNKKENFIEITSVTYNLEEKGKKISSEEFLEHSKRPDFNILFYDFPMPEDGQNGYFHLKGTGKVISIYSNKHINNMIAK
ncbi:MAG: hypothetical protein WEA99_14980 [Brumimicrobium sp.]